MTPGQIWTCVLGLLLAGLLLAYSLPPVLHQRNAPAPTVSRTP